MHDNDLAARIVADLAAIHDADRQLDLFQKVLLPRLRQLQDLTRSGYETGQSTFLELLEARRSLLATEQLVANLRVARDKRLLDLEALSGRDLATGGYCPD